MNIESCRVITCCFLDGRSPRNNSPGTREQCLDLMKKIISVECELNSDTPYDIIIVNHDTGYVEGNKYLESIDGLKTKSGIIRVVTTENKGLSLDGFNTAFEMFSEDYRYWIFSEDDHVLFHHNYFHKLILEFNSLEQTGFLALAPKSNSTPEHSGGGFGLTTRENLQKIYDKEGSLPCLRTKGNRVAAEVFFTNAFVQNGMSIVENKTFCLSPINVEKCADHLINLKQNINNLPHLFKVGM